MSELQPLERPIEISLISIVLVLFTACTSKSESSLIGIKPFQFNPKEVTELVIAKSDPLTEDHWIATFHPNQGHWEIASSPENQALLDPLADETFINHLLDVIRDIKVEAPAPRGALGSNGLEPPRFAIRWQTPAKSWEFRLGLPYQHRMNFFSLGGSATYLATGPALKMLTLIETFQSLRRRVWTMIAPDDVDEIQVLRQGKPVFYAQREGDRWTDRKHQLIKRDLDTLVGEVVMARSEQFIDDPAQSAQLKKTIEGHSMFEARLSDRQGNVTQVKVFQQDHKLYGLNSSRPTSVFVLNPKLLQVFENAIL